MVRSQYLSRVRDHYIDYPIVPVSQLPEGFIAELRHDSVGPWEVAQVLYGIRFHHDTIYPRITTHLPRRLCKQGHVWETDRKSTRLNSSHVAISYAVFCLKKKNKT